MYDHNYRAGDRIRYIAPDDAGHTVRFGALATVIADRGYRASNAVWLELDNPDTAGRTYVWTELEYIELFYARATDEEENNLLEYIKELTDA